MWKDTREFGPDVCEFWQPNRIPRSPLSANTYFLRWLAPDSESNYQQRGNREFGIDSVGYEFNSLGYRGPEFVRERGEAAVVFVGDSNTIGIGMPWPRVWTSIVTNHLQQQWGVPVRQCNLAWGGTGSDYAAMVIHQSIEVIRPAAVFILWSYINRVMWFPDPGRQVHFWPQYASARDAQEHLAYLRLATQPQGFFNYVRNFHLINSRLQQLRIPYYWGNIERLPTDTLRHYLPLDGYVGNWLRADSDFARDGRHAGPKTHARFAAGVIDALERDSAAPGQHESMSGPPAVPTVRRDQGQTRGEPTARSARTFLFVARSIQSSLAERSFRRRVRAMRKKDPFIY